MKSGWKNRKSAPVFEVPFIICERCGVRGHFFSDTSFVLFAVMFHSGLPGSPGAHLCRISKFLRRGVEGFLSCGSGFHGFILS